MDDTLKIVIESWLNQKVPSQLLHTFHLVFCVCHERLKWIERHEVRVFFFKLQKSVWRKVRSGSEKLTPQQQSEPIQVEVEENVKKVQNDMDRLNLIEEWEEGAEKSLRVEEQNW